MMSDKKSSSGSAGAIRAGGGAFAKMAVAHEEEYFYKQVSYSSNQTSWSNLNFNPLAASGAVRQIEEEAGRGN